VESSVAFGRELQTRLVQQGQRSFCDFQSSRQQQLRPSLESAERHSKELSGLDANTAGGIEGTHLWRYGLNEQRTQYPGVVES
jgi:hypothetical protein